MPAADRDEPWWRGLRDGSSTTGGRGDLGSALHLVWGSRGRTQRMYVSSGGLDHLGSASVVQDRLLPALSPGINVVTVHPRYWSFFTFVIDEFWQLDGRKTTWALNAFLRERESIYGTACLLCSNHGTDIRQVVGFNKLSHRAAVPVDFDGLFDYIKARAAGDGQTRALLSTSDSFSPWQHPRSSLRHGHTAGSRARCGIPTGHSDHSLLQRVLPRRRCERALQGR